MIRIATATFLAIAAAASAGEHRIDETAARGLARLMQLGVDVVMRQHQTRHTDFRRGKRLGARVSV